jgi:TatA/E family protein of Tat protein translocase
MQAAFPGVREDSVFLLQQSQKLGSPKKRSPKKLVPFIADEGWAKYHTAMNLGIPEMIFIFLLALLLFGPKKLPQAGRELGKALSEFKRASNEFKHQLETEIAQAEAREREPAGLAPASTEFSADPMRQPLAQPIQGETIEPRILPPSEPTVATTVGKAVEIEPSHSQPPAADLAQDRNLAASNLAAVEGENIGSIHLNNALNNALNKALLREFNA